FHNEDALVVLDFRSFGQKHLDHLPRHWRANLDRTGLPLLRGLSQRSPCIDHLHCQALSAKGNHIAIAVRRDRDFYGPVLPIEPVGACFQRLRLERILPAADFGFNAVGLVEPQIDFDVFAVYDGCVFHRLLRARFLPSTFQALWACAVTSGACADREEWKSAAARAAKSRSTSVTFR